jgi:hypothetical protein
MHETPPNKTHPLSMNESEQRAALSPSEQGTIERAADEWRNAGYAPLDIDASLWSASNCRIERHTKETKDERHTKETKERRMRSKRKEQTKEIHNGPAESSSSSDSR